MPGFVIIQPVFVFALAGIFVIGQQIAKGVALLAKGLVARQRHQRAGGIHRAAGRTQVVADQVIHPTTGFGLNAQCNAFCPGIIIIPPYLVDRYPRRECKCGHAAGSGRGGFGRRGRFRRRLGRGETGGVAVHRGERLGRRAGDGGGARHPRCSVFEYSRRSRGFLGQ